MIVVGSQSVTTDSQRKRVSGGDSSSDDDLSLAAVMRITWSYRLLVVCVVFASTLIGAAYAFLATPTYRAAVTTILRDMEGEKSGAQALLGQLGIGGISALGGLLGGFGSKGVEEAFAWLGSRQFAEQFIQEENLLPVLFDDEWDASRNAWRADLDADEIPTLEDAWELFDKKIRKIHRDQQTGIVTLQVEWKDPELAARWANLMIARANEELRQRTLNEADASLAYLDRELQQQTAVTLQQTIYGLMEMQIRRKVLANSRPDFAFSIIDPAKAPDSDNMSAPKRALVIVLSMFGGIVLGIFVAVAADSLRSRERQMRSDDGT